MPCRRHQTRCPVRPHQTNQNSAAHTHTTPPKPNQWLFDPTAEKKQFDIQATLDLEDINCYGPDAYACVRS